jgi:anti-anti-sigma regulatory factor
VIVALGGDLDAAGSVGAGDVLSDLIDGQGNLSVEVHLALVGRIDPSAVDALASVAAKTAVRGGKLTLVDPTGAVRGALVLAGLGDLVRVPLQDVDQHAGTRSSGSCSASISSQPAGGGRDHRHQRGGRT